MMAVLLEQLIFFALLRKYFQISSNENFELCELLAYGLQWSIGEFVEGF